MISCGKYLGRVSKIRIGHDNTGFGAAWFLDKVMFSPSQVLSNTMRTVKNVTDCSLKLKCSRQFMKVPWRMCD